MLTRASEMSEACFKDYRVRVPTGFGTDQSKAHGRAEFSGEPLDGGVCSSAKNCRLEGGWSRMVPKSFLVDRRRCAECWFQRATACHGRTALNSHADVVSKERK